MKQEIKKLLPKIQAYMRKLEQTEKLIERSWVLQKEDNSHEKYLFKRNNELIISRMGNVVKGHWEFLEFANSILIESENSSFLFNKGFMLDGLLIFKKDGTENDLFILFDEKIIPDHDINRYISSNLNLLEKGKNDNRIGSYEENYIKTYKYNKKKIVLHQRSGDTINIGDQVYNDERAIAPDGKYRISFWLRIEVKDGKVERVW